MVNTDDFVKRLEKILRYYNLTASAFADRIKVQRSSISHLLTGRNKPSLEFVMKVVKTFPEVNLYWLLNGKGTFPAEVSQSPTPETGTKTRTESPTVSKTIEKIIIFYGDGSFRAFDKNIDDD